MKSELTLEEYKRLFIRFCKQEGSWIIWKNYFKKYKNFDKVIALCLPNISDDRRFFEYNIGYGYNLIISTPYNIDCKFKRFSTDDIYDIFPSISSIISKENFLQFLREYILNNEI